MRIVAEAHGPSAEERSLYLAPASRPTAAQRAAATAAEIRARELLGDFPAPTWYWGRATPHTQELGCCRCYAHGTGADIYLRDNPTPDQTYAVALHELRHLYDADLIVQHRISHEEAERRAEAFAAYAMTGETTMDHFTELSARVDDLVARGFDRSHAWEIVGRQNPPRVAAPAVTGGAAPVRRCICGGVLLHCGLGKIRECPSCGRRAFD